MIFQRVLCVFGLHKYQPKAVYHYYDVSYGGNSKSSNVTSKCECCNKIKIESFYGSGFLEIKDLV